MILIWWHHLLPQYVQNLRSSNVAAVYELKSWEDDLKIMAENHRRHQERLDEYEQKNVDTNRNDDDFEQRRYLIPHRSGGGGGTTGGDSKPEKSFMFW